MDEENVSDPSAQLRHIKKLRNFSKEKTDNLSSSISRFILNFGEKQAKLSKLILCTQKQQLAIENISTLRNSLQNTLDLLNTSSKFEPIIESPIKDNFEQYISALEEIKNARLTLMSRQFEDRGKAIEGLNRMENSGYDHARRYFSQINDKIKTPFTIKTFSLVDGNFKVNDPELEKDIFYPITPTQFDHLIALVHLLKNDSSDMEFRKENTRTPEYIFKQSRSTFLTSSLHEYIVKAEQKRKLTQQTLNVLDIANYKQRKHPIHMFSFTMQFILLRERRIAEKMFGDNYISTLSLYVISPLTYYATQVEKLRKPVVSHVDILFDLDLVTTINLVIDDLESTFTEIGDAENPIKTLKGYLRDFNNTIVDVLSKYIDGVANHDFNFVTPTGSVSPLTSNVLHYLNVLYKYQPVLNNYEVLTMEYVSTTTVTKLMQNLDAKSKKYTDRVISTLFLMNNAHYAYNAIINSNLNGLVSTEVCQNIEDIISKSQDSYFQLTWDTAFNILNSQAVGEVKAGERLSKKQCKILKKQFKDFAQQMQVILHKHKKYCTIYVKLMAPIRNDATKKVNTTYEKFFHKWKDSGFAKNPEKYYCFQPATLADRISRLYGSEGNEGENSSHNESRKGSVIVE